MLNSLEIINFRAFMNLKISHIGRVNLIVGRNNVGKTSLLEAIHLYSSDNVLGAVLRLLRRRQEYSSEKNESLLFDSLFYKHDGSSSRIEIGEVNDMNQLVIRPMWRWIEETDDDERIRRLRQFNDSPPEDLEIETTEVLTAKRGTGNIQSIPMNLDSYPDSYPDWLSSPGRLTRRYRGSYSSLFLPSSGFQDDSLDTAELWDRIVLTDKEFSVLDALKVIEPDLERIVMVQGKSGRRRAIVKLRQQKTMSLRSLGDGMNKLFELAIGLVNAGEDGTFLVDEIDSGLHFTTLVDLWELIFRTAENLKVQIFATSHSWDCIEAFQAAASIHPSDSFLIRLEKNQEDVSAEVFSEKELAIIARESIEVR